MNNIDKVISIMGVLALFIALFTVDWDLGLVDLVALLAVVEGKQLPFGNVIKIIGEIIVIIISVVIIVIAGLFIWSLVVIK